MHHDYMIVDAYNVINASSDLVQFQEISLEMSRERLISMMQEYASYHDVNVIIVFDAWNSGRKMRTYENAGNVRVVFSRNGETADSVIERMSRELVTAGFRVYVATSDKNEQDVIFGVGALRKSARELINECKAVPKKSTRHKDKPFSTAIAGRIDEEILMKLEQIGRLNEK